MTRFSVVLSRVDAVGRTFKSIRVEIDGHSRRDAATSALDYHSGYSRAMVTHVIRPNGDHELLPTTTTVHR